MYYFFFDFFLTFFTGINYLFENAYSPPPLAQVAGFSPCLSHTWVAGNLFINTHSLSLSLCLTHNTKWIGHPRQRSCVIQTDKEMLTDIHNEYFANRKVTTARPVAGLQSPVHVLMWTVKLPVKLV